VLPNPVITSLVHESDIPDWYFEEFLRPGPPLLDRLQLPPSLYETLYAASPIAHVGHVKAPVLLLLGSADHRVSNCHGRAFYHALKARASEVGMYVFPGQGHGIDGVEEARAVFEATLGWFTKHSSE